MDVEVTKIEDMVSEALGERYLAIPNQAQVGGISHQGIQLASRSGHRCYVRLAPSPGPYPPYDLGAEAAVMEIASGVVDVPEVLYLSEAHRNGVPPFMVLDWIEGEVKLPPRGRREVGDEERTGIAREMIDTLARIHSVAGEDVDDKQVVGAGATAGLSHRLTDRWYAVLSSLERTVPPALAYGAVWLRSEPPPESSRRLLHGDFRLGNVIWSGQRRYVLDWEFSNVGDPMYDLGWLLMGAIEHDDPVMGLVSKEEMIRLYEEAMGVEVDRSVLAWWEIFAVWQRGVMEARIVDYEVRELEKPDLRNVLWEFGACYTAYELLSRITRFGKTWA